MTNAADWAKTFTLMWLATLTLLESSVHDLSSEFHIKIHPVPQDSFSGVSPCHSCAF